jgi:hypothetical protein
MIPSRTEPESNVRNEQNNYTNLQTKPFLYTYVSHFNRIPLDSRNMEKHNLSKKLDDEMNKATYLEIICQLKTFGDRN